MLVEMGVGVGNRSPVDWAAMMDRGNVSALAKMYNRIRISVSMTWEMCLGMNK
jgi:hypothetical protein